MTGNPKAYSQNEIDKMRCPACDAPVVCHKWKVTDKGVYQKIDFVCGCSVTSPDLDPYLQRPNSPATDSIDDWAPGPDVEIGDRVFINETPHIVTGTSNSTEGKKYDDGKLRYHVMPDAAEQEVIEVLNFGADKYGENNWRTVTPLNTRYYNAMRRHVAAFRRGERLDEDSGKHHLAHAACCLLFMLENDIEQTASEEPTPWQLKRQAD